MVSMVPTARAAVRSPAVELFPVGPITTELRLLGDITNYADITVRSPLSGSTTPPHPADTQFVSTAEFARSSGLPQGSGATVVLRVEVLGTGAVGQVEVDVSGGSRRIDQAAIAYVRILNWVGGRVEDKPETLWIRWGVRLNG
jgi:hypothetical protein